ncbi:PIG-L family deacetylase [Nocardia vinacea]|uniref:PIG-L deacetylase family protein n=1 Tax=Nocardia vinacea TaxID=96468 RepID=UPI002E0D9391|nr:PIG-L family deacetylase [Nocardia vinacea]
MLDETHQKHIVVSPHLDDAVLSSTWPILHHSAQVLTVFAGAPDPGSPIGWWDAKNGVKDSTERVAERITEDIEALDLLGTQSAGRLNILEAQYREKPAASAEFVEILQPLLDSATHVWGPAGMARHPDHWSVNEALRILAARNDTKWSLRFYSEVPYCIDEEWFALASRCSSTPPSGYRRLDAHSLAMKRSAVAAYKTQVGPLGLTLEACGDIDPLGVERYS